MFWPLVAVGALSMGQSLLGNRVATQQAAAENRARAAANHQTVLNTAQSVGAINVQAAELRTNAARQLHEAEVAALAATGSATANAAAAGVRGASVDAVVGDIDRELSEAQVTTAQNLELGQYNLQNRLREVIAGASASLRGEVSAQTTNPLLAGLFSAGGAYLNNYMRFGAGSSVNQPTVDTGTVQTFAAPTRSGFTVSP
ncbi:hypothetical protein D3C77_34770 [compost metagenome]